MVTAQALGGLPSPVPPAMILEIAGGEWVRIPGAVDLEAGDRTIPGIVVV